MKNFQYRVLVFVVTIQLRSKLKFNSVVLEARLKIVTNYPMRSYIYVTSCIALHFLVLRGFAKNITILFARLGTS